MDISEKAPLANSLEYLRDRFQVCVPSDVSRAYFSGELSDPGVYEKVGQGSLDGKPFWSYLLAAEGYLKQPSLKHYYDIYRAARAIPIVRRVDELVRLFEDTELLPHAKRLNRSTSFDELDAVLFEVIVAGAYRKRFPNATVSFVPESPPAKSPDLAIEFPQGRTLFVECKTFNRMNLFQAEMRLTMRKLLSPVMAMLKDKRQQRLVHFRIDCSPAGLDESEILDAFEHALRNGHAHVNDKFSVALAKLGTPDRGFLYPSPKYFLQRYGYTSAQWHGIMPAMEGRRSGVSFFDRATWECALLWRVEHQETLWRARKLNFKPIFDGLKQRRHDERINVHVWFERNAALGHRGELLNKFFGLLDEDTEPFSQIVFNETYTDVTPGGYFDFQEHTSAIGGPRRDVRPEMMNVFINDEDIAHFEGEWGVGHILPSLDEQNVGDKTKRT